MNEFIALNRLLLSIVEVVPAIVLSSALLTLLAYWSFIGRHASKETPDKEAEALRIMQGIKIGLKLRNRRSDIEPEVTITTEEIPQ